MNEVTNKTRAPKTFRLKKYLYFVIPIFVSTQISAAWLVNDILGTTATNTVNASILTLNTNAGILVPVPTVAMPILIATKDTLDTLVIASRVEKLAGLAKCVEVVVDANHVVDAAIFALCVKAKAIDLAIASAHFEYTNEMRILYAEIAGFNLLVAPTLALTTGQIQAVTKVHATQATLTSMYNATVTNARAELQDIKELINELNTKKIYGI